MSFFETLLCALFPDRCVGCRTPGSLLCTPCRAKIPPAPSPKHAFMTSAYAYRDPRMRRVIKLLKYKNTRHVAALFGGELAGMLAELLGEERPFLSAAGVLVVPVPLSKGRLRTRGYNQAELLVRAMLAEHARTGASDAPLVRLETKLLEKFKETKSQADISKKSERLANLGGCFRVCEGREMKGETIVLIDDVATTGATLLACKETLELAGFRCIYAFTLAH